ncbi:MAG: cystathionine gamma-synthase family protein [Gemmatimonadota bacterium]
MSQSRHEYHRRAIAGRQLRPESLMMGFGYDPHLSEGSLKPPIFQTSTFVFESAEDGKAFFELAYGLREKDAREEPGLIYSRINNPDIQVLEERLCVWDEAEAGLTFASGMAAIATTMLTFLRPGDALVHSDPIYGGTEFLVTEVLPEFGVHVEFFRSGVPGSLEAAVERATARGRLGMIYVETPANPTNAVVDIAHCRALADGLSHADGRRPLVAVDNTFLGPLWQHPLKVGADLVLYSLTKYVGGHSDLIAGACLGAEREVAQVRGMRTILGTMADAWTAWLVMRSLETLKLRMTCSMKNARKVAEFLREHPRVTRVDYLGFLEEGSPAHEVCERQCVAAGSTFSFEVEGGEAAAFGVLNKLRIIHLAVSLGGTESLAQHPRTMTHADVPTDKQDELGITPGLVRLSIGIEHPDDVIADLRQALETG